MPSKYTIAPTRMSSEQLRLELMEQGYTSDLLHSMKKARMVEMVREFREQRKEEPTSQPTLVETQSETTAAPAPVTTEQNTPPAMVEEPHPTDANWCQYVIGLLQGDEVEGQNPRVDGLRRVSEFLIGPIMEEGCELVSPPTIENGHRACVKAWIVFKTHEGEKRFESLADVCEENCDPEFARFPTSTAETRAKGRCFRMALKLRKVMAAEEATTEIPLAGENQSDVAIQNGQISMIQLMADRLNVSIDRLLSSLEIKKGSLGQLTRTEGLMVTKHLNTLQQSGLIPPGLLRTGGN